MYNIQIAESAQFNSNPASKPPQTGWIFDPPTELTIFSFLGAANPSPITVDTTIKDYIYAYGTGTYDDFYIKLTVVHPVINGSTVQWLTVTGPIAEATGDGYELTQANLNVDTDLAFNVTNVPRGFTETRFEFKAYGKRPSGQIDLLETITYRVYLRRLNSGEIFMSPSGIIEFSYVIGGSIPASKSKTLYCLGAFTVTVGDHIALSGSGTFALSSDVGGVKTYSGSGSQTITFTLEASIDSETDIDPWYITEAGFTTSSGGAYGVPIRVYVYDSGVGNVIPSSLQFEAIKGIKEATPLFISIQGVGAWTITKPNWLEQSGTSSGNNSDVRQIYPTHSDNLTPGIYTGKIKVVLAGVDYFIDVTHNVIDGLQTGFSPAFMNFTKDREAISDIYGLDTQKVSLLVEIKSVFYNSFLNRNFSFDGTKGIFNNKAEFWVGDIAHKAMPSLKSLADIGLDYFHFQNSQQGISDFPHKVLPFYNPSLVHFLMKYLNRFTGEVEGDPREYYGVQFLKGRKPNRVANNYGIIDYKSSPVRVTKKSITILPVYRNSSASLIEIYRNGALFKKIYPERGEFKFFGVQLQFAAFTPGDVIEARIIGSVSSQSIEESFSQLYIMFPEGKLSYHIAWENEHGVPEVLEFTGDYMFKSEHKGVIAQTFEKFLQVYEKVYSDRKLKFTANTGWILKSNQERIDSLVDANRAWIVFKDDRPPIALVPDDAKITNIDSDAGTYQYDVEFTINPAHELENNSF